MNAFRQLLQGPTRPVGTWIMSASPLIAEAVGQSGFDWAVVDMEHTPLDMMEIVHLLQAIGNTKLVPVVRVPWNEPVLIKRVLDAGATTLLVPFVQNADEARAAVASTRYAPQGIRGMAAMSRASRFGTTPDYLKTANAGQCVIVQLETPEAIARLDEIAAVDGVDALFIGPGDLSAAMGFPGEPMREEVMVLVAQAVARARQLGKPIGTVGGNAEALARYRATGFDFLAIASDLGLLMRGLRASLAAVRQQERSAAADTAAPAAPTGPY